MSAKILLCALMLVLISCSPSNAELGEGDPPTQGATTTSMPVVDSVPVAGNPAVAVKPGPLLPQVPELDAISGYGNFSHLAYADIDWVLVTEAQVECANDHGIPVRIIPPGDGISFDEVAIDQHLMAAAIVKACFAGLNLPPYEPPSERQIADFYNKLVELKACLEREGYAIEDPPSEESFVETYLSGDVWHPYDSVPLMGIEDWNNLNQVCPQP